jgi:hypothetical protein
LLGLPSNGLNIRIASKQPFAFANVDGQKVADGVTLGSFFGMGKDPQAKVARTQAPATFG